VQKQKPKKHHFVPECYLRNFLVDRQFFILDTVKLKKGMNEYPKPSLPAKICYFEDYYKIQPEFKSNTFPLGNLDELFIESKVLKNLEDKFPALYLLVTEQQSLTLQDAIDLADFIIQLKLRNPFWLNNVIEKKKDEWIDAILSDISSVAKKNPRFAKIADEKKQQLIDMVRERNKTDPNFSKQLLLFSLFQRYNSDEGDDERNRKIRETMIDCSWKLLVAPANGPYFITSDNPGFSLDTNKIVYNTRFIDYFEFYFPLSPTYCLFLTSTDKDDCFKNQTPTKKVKKLNVEFDRVIVANDKTIQIVSKLLVSSQSWYLSEIVKRNKPVDLT
jgi:hypothetical protein